MQYIEEFRNEKFVKSITQEIKDITTQRWVLMEMCGGQTHAIFRFGINELIPEEIELVHGPGCPVCVTPLELIDKALFLAKQPNIIFTSFGDMLRVPGSNTDLFKVRANGGQVKVVFSPLDAVKIAQENPDKEVIFFAIGFETTAPPNIMSVLQAKSLGLKNFSLLVSQVCVPPAIKMILNSPNNRVQGFLAAGHVCTVMGYKEYIPIANDFNVPIVITGFEPIDLLSGILNTVKQLEAGKAEVLNAYSRVVNEEGNPRAIELINQVYEPCDRKWRGIGTIPDSGWKLREEYSLYDAEKKFKVGHISVNESPICIAGEILQGLKKPIDCKAFAKECTPNSPLGATMVSSEGACAAYYMYHRYNNLENE